MDVKQTIPAMKVTDDETGNVYELDFSREAVKFAENHGFKISEALDFPTTHIPTLFYYAFRKNHRNVARDKTDALLTELGGLQGKYLVRLVDLYQQAALYNVVRGDDEEEVKNSKVTVEL
jgi:hypothetical protein